MAGLAGGQYETSARYDPRINQGCDAPTPAESVTSHLNAALDNQRRLNERLYNIMVKLYGPRPMPGHDKVARVEGPLNTLHLARELRENTDVAHNLLSEIDSQL